MSDAVSARTAPRYRRSALVAGLRVAGRAWRVVVPVVVVAALGQALLVLPDAVPGQSATAAVLALVSFLVVALALALVVAAVLESSDGVVTWSAVVARVRRRGWVVALWFLAWLVAVSVGLALWVVPGLVVVLLTPYLLVAAGDDAGNALAVDLATIRARIGRWLVTSVVMGVIAGVAWLLAAVSGFFVGGPVSALLTWLLFGALASWFLATWAVIYRSVDVRA